MSENSAVPESGSARDDERKSGPVSPDERKLLTTAAAILAVGAAIVQIAGTNGESPARSIMLAALTVAAGIPLLIGAARLARVRHKQVRVSILLAAGLVTVAGLTGGTAGYLIAHAGGPGQPTAGKPRPGPSGNLVTTPPSPSPQPRPASAARLYSEITDNENGTPVFTSAQGGAVADEESIPFDRHVLVKCWTANNSGIPSVNAFYVVESGPWSGDYAPANTFANGDPVGQPGSTTIDPAVPECP